MKIILKKNKRMLEVEALHKCNVEELLRQKFVDEDKPLHTVAQELSISYVTVIKWLRLAGIRSRKIKLTT